MIMTWSASDMQFSFFREPVIRKNTCIFWYHILHTSKLWTVFDEDYKYKVENLDVKNGCFSIISIKNRYNFDFFDFGF